MTLLATCCLCCHPEERKDGGNYYEKMGYYDKWFFINIYNI